MERIELIGMLLIAVVGSTVVTLLIQGGTDIPLELLEDDFPETIPAGQRSTHEISVSFVLRRPAESLALDFDCLYNVTRKEGEPVEGAVKNTQICLDLLDQIGAPYVQQEIEVDGGEGTLYDLSAAFSVFAPESAVISATTVFCIADVDGSPFAFRGVSDFFRNRNRSLDSIRLSRNEIAKTYLTLEGGQAERGSGNTVMDAPLLGRNEYRDIRQDDRFSARLMVNSIGVPGHLGMMEVLRLYVDGEPEVARGYLIS